jgi:hypothetical protein
VYGLVPRSGDGCNPYVVTRNPSGGSRAIAVVEAFDAPNAASDLAVFSAQFGFPAPTSANLQVVYASAGVCTTGGVKPGYDLGWEAEATLDVQWAHAMAPHATIYVVEAPSDSPTDLFAAVAVASQCVAANGVGEVSMSWGFFEASDETAFDGLFTQKGVVYFAATGDSPGALYPSASPNVVAVGGTSLVRNPLPWRGNLGDFQGEVVWNWGPTEGTGGGPSLYEPRPFYQYLITNIVGSSRGTPDVAAVADPFTGVWIYDTNLMGWLVVGGTSVSTPVWAGIVNAAGRFNNSTAAELAQIYQAHCCSRKLPEASRTSPPVRAVSDPTSRASWPPKAGTSAPGSAVRSVILASRHRITRPVRQVRERQERPPSLHPPWSGPDLCYLGLSIDFDPYPQLGSIDGNGGLCPFCDIRDHGRTAMSGENRPVPSRRQPPTTSGSVAARSTYLQAPRASANRGAWP